MARTAAETSSGRSNKGGGERAGRPNGWAQPLAAQPVEPGLGGVGLGGAALGGAGLGGAELGGVYTSNWKTQRVSQAHNPFEGDAKGVKAVFSYCLPV